MSTSEIDLSGATVLHVHPGDRLGEVLAGVEIRLVCGVDDVIVQQAEPQIAEQAGKREAVSA